MIVGSNFMRSDAFMPARMVLSIFWAFLFEKANA
jgi:hypothetical protein